MPLPLIINLNNNTYKFSISVNKSSLNPPGIFTVDEYTDNIPINKDIIYDQKNDKNIIKKLYEILRNNVNSFSDIDIDEEVITLSKPMELHEIKDMSVNKVAGSTKPLFKIYKLQTNNIKACYAYFTSNFNHPQLQIIGNPNSLYTLYFEQDNKGMLYDKLLTEQNKIFFGTNVNTELCPKCEKCPQCEKCEKCPECNSCCPQLSCPTRDITCASPEELTRPYRYSLYFCIFIIFCLLLFLFYKLNQNKEKH